MDTFLRMGRSSDPGGAVIVERQNQPAAIEQLAAQRQLYRETKRVDAVRLFLSLVLALGSFALPYLWPPGTSWLRALAGLWLICDLAILRGLARDLHTQAALIQEEFDISVLMLPWNETAAGSRVAREHIISAARRSPPRDKAGEGLKDWYPDVSGLPLPLARLVCQRTNIVWDGQLRQRYSSVVFLLTLSLGIGTLVYALFTGTTVLNYLLTFLPAVPAMVLGAEIVKGQRAAAVRIEELRKLVQKAWDQATTGSLTAKKGTELSRQLQDQIFAGRKMNPLVPEIIYRLFRNPYETDSRECATRLVQEAAAGLDAKKVG